MLGLRAGGDTSRFNKMEVCYSSNKFISVRNPCRSKRTMGAFLCRGELCVEFNALTEPNFSLSPKEYIVVPAVPYISEDLHLDNRI